MWSVVMLSSVLSTTLPVIGRLASALPSGNGLMFGPRTTSTSAGFSGAACTIMIVVDGESARASGCRGISPRRARIGQHDLSERTPPRPPGRRDRSVASCVPERPSKLRLKVRRETPADSGRLTHADAGTAGALENTRARGNDVGKRAVLREHVEHLLGAGADGQGNVRVRRSCP